MRFLRFAPITLAAYIGFTVCAIGSCAVDKPVDDVCGPIPSRGSYTVTYSTVNGQSVAIMPRADFDALTAERHALKEWALCMGGTIP